MLNMNVCVYVHMRVRICARMRVRAYVHMFLYVCVCVCVCVCVGVCVCERDRESVLTPMHITVNALYSLLNGTLGLALIAHFYTRCFYSVTHYALSGQLLSVTKT